MRRTMEEVHNEVLSGNIHAFYVSREWKDKKKQIIIRDNNLCQRCLGNWSDGKHPIEKIKLTRGTKERPLYVHHIKPMKDYFELALEDDNLISLCFECHEIVEERTENRFKPKKKYLTQEKW